MGQGMRQGMGQGMSRYGVLRPLISKIYDYMFGARPYIYIYMCYMVNYDGIYHSISDGVVSTG